MSRNTNNGVRVDVIDKLSVDTLTCTTETLTFRLTAFMTDLSTTAAILKDMERVTNQRLRYNRMY